MSLRDAAQQALEALVASGLSGHKTKQAREAAITALRTALAEPEPRNQCGETCERAKLCAVCARGIADGNKDQYWDEIEALRASLREHMAEIKRLTECLTWEQHRAEHIGTHGFGCAEWGPKHYECLLLAYNVLKKRTTQESRQVEPVAVWELQESGWEIICDGDWVKELPLGTKLYTAPPKREPLTDEEIAVTAAACNSLESEFLADFARAIERAHGIGDEE